MQKRGDPIERQMDFKLEKCVRDTSHLLPETTSGEKVVKCIACLANSDGYVL